MFQGRWINLYPVLIQAINLRYEFWHQFWLHLICEHYQNITSRHVFTVVFGIWNSQVLFHCFTYFADLQISSPHQTRTRSYSGLYFPLFGKFAHPKNWTRFSWFGRPIGIGCTVCLALFKPKSYCAYFSFKWALTFIWKVFYHSWNLED